ncbi:hypothetical protein [Pseudonocardia zijingensis]|uniref:Uncharacterized protein n=1 Tax=Pseudonocardia zijingensis TaxID=153376 RepID=A0ABN1PD62_9PSEU
MIACAIALAACTTSVEGQAGRLGTSLGLPPVPVIPDEPARWAMSVLDPCALLRDMPLKTARPEYPVRPHSCAVEHAPDEATTWWESEVGGLYTRVDGEILELHTLVVHVGAAFSGRDRSTMVKTEIGGRIAYQSHGKNIPSYEIGRSGDRCRIDFPISADRSIQIVSSAPDGDMATACAAPRAVAETVAAKLASPAASARATPRWTACDLVKQAAGYVPSDDPGLTADTCLSRVLGANHEEIPSVEIDTIADEGLREPSPYISETRVDLPFGAAVQSKAGADQCTVEFVAGTQPDAPADFAAQIMSVRLAKSLGEPCAGAAEVAAKIHEALSGPAPAPPPPPPHLGFAVGEPDAEMPAACGAFSGTVPETCRMPLPVPVPATAPEVLRASETLFAADMTCAVLHDAAAPVLGDAIEVAAQMNAGGGGCIGLTNDAYVVYLGFFPDATAGEYCRDFERNEVQIAGRTVTQCSDRDTFNLYLPAAPDPGVPGVALVEARLVAPRGDMSWNPGRSDPAAMARMGDGTTRMAENVITRTLAG